MKRLGWFTATLALVGVVAALAPIVFTVIVTNWGALGTERFVLDWLLPLELFPVTLLGLALILWASLRARLYRALVGLGLGAIAALFAGAAAWVQLSGLASGRTEPTDATGIIAGALMAAYLVALITVCVGGTLVAKKAIAARHASATPVAPTA